MGTSKEVYVYLEFNEKLTPTIFNNKVFLRVANLHKSNPLVQLNDLVFEGSLQDSVGTNIFFEKLENFTPNRKSDNVYDTLVGFLKPVVVQSKIIKLKQIKLPKKVLSPNQLNESVVLNLDQDYNVVLEKLEQGILNLHDLAERDIEEPVENVVEGVDFDDKKEASVKTEVVNYLGLLSDNSPNALLEAKYERLKRLAKRPVRRMKSPELVEECDPKYKNAYEYHNLEHQILQNNDAFVSVNGPIVEDSLVGGVDIDKCVLQGLIEPSEKLNRILTKEEQAKVFNLNNFENLSIPVRYVLLKNCVSRIEELIESSSSEELIQTDENGQTIGDVCDIFRKLVETLKRHINQSTEDVKVMMDKCSKNSHEQYIKYNPKSISDLTVEHLNILNESEGIHAEGEIIAREKEVSSDSGGEVEMLSDNLNEIESMKGNNLNE